MASPEDEVKNTSAGNTFGGGPAPTPTPSTPVKYTKEDFLKGDIGKQYLDKYKNLNNGEFDYFPDDRQNAWNDYVKNGSSWDPSIRDSADSLNDATKVVPGAPKDSGEINVTDAASDLLKDPTTIVFVLLY